MKVRSRFSYFRDKLQVFFLGLLFGLVLGGGFFVLKLDQYVKELSFYKSLTQQSDKPESSANDLKPETEKVKPKKPRRTETISSNDSASAAVSNDSTSFPAVFDNDHPDDGIVIRKDELLGQQVYPLHSIASASADSASKTTSVTPGNITIEFWRSPLNYHGYKFSRNKLILFGLESGDVQSLFKGENGTYLKSLTGVYKLDISSDFHQLEQVSDENLISRMQ